MGTATVLNLEPAGDGVAATGEGPAEKIAGVLRDALDKIDAAK
jgi:hypothetical protein